MGSSNRKASHIIGYLVSMGMGTLLSFILLLAASFAVYKTSDPDKIYKGVSLAVLVLSAIIGGFVTSKITETGGMGGAVFGAWLLLVTLIFALFTEGASLPLATSVLLRLALVPIGFLGGFLGRKREKKMNVKKSMKRLRR